MNRQQKNIRKALRFIGFYIPFTWYFILFAAGCWVCFQWLNNKEQVPGSSYTDIFNLLLTIAVRFCMALIAFALLTTFISFLYFRWKRKKPGIDFKIDSKEEALVKKKQKQVIQLHIHPILKPFLGFVKLRLQYGEDLFSDKFLLQERSQKKLINNTIDGIYHWPLPEIKEYRIERAIIYFEDFFQFFSFAVTLNTNNQFYTQPNGKTEKDIIVSPRKTEETNTRIEELKNVEGEYLNYKNFENNDDVRRIVWKIYARNKELVVRIPEILDPYASHIYLYPSFFAAFAFEGNSAVEVPFLNYFKNCIWSAYQQLIKQGFDVRYVSDQEIPPHNFPDAQQLVKYSISTSNWQNQKDLSNFVKTKDASMVIIHSLSDAKQVQELIDQYGNDILFVFIQLSDSLNRQHIGDWLQWLFVQQEKDDIAMYKTNWSLSLLRPKILQNEKQLKKILSPYSKTVMV